jgi:hypothetical protein
MTADAWLNLIGLVSNIAGTIFLAYSLDKYLKMMDGSINALEVFTEAYATPGQNIPVITGMDKHRDKARKGSGKWTRYGIVLVIIGFSLQLIALIVQIKKG